MEIGGDSAKTACWLSSGKTQSACLQARARRFKEDLLLDQLLRCSCVLGRSVPQVKRINRLLWWQHRMIGFAVSLRNNPYVFLCFIEWRNAVVLINIAFTGVVSSE